MASQAKSTEQEPLLRRATSSDNISPPESEPKQLTKWLGFTTIAPKYRWIPLLGCAIIFTNEAEYYIKQVATMRAIEAMYCYEYYLEQGSPLVELGKHIPEKLCKHDSIQKDLASTAGLVMFVRMLSAILGAIPLAWVADRYGRKAVLILHKVGVCFTCSFWVLIYVAFPKLPIWTLYLTGITGLIGGNFDVGLAMLFASYNDVMPSSTERASLFFMTTSMQYFAQTFCPAIGAWLMNLDGKGGTPEVNLFASLGLAIVTALIAIFIFPETVGESHDQKSNADVETSTALDQSPPEDTSLPWVRKRLQTFSETVSGVGVVNIVLLSISICFAATGIKAIDWYALIQYPVIKLHWTFSEASSMVSLQGILLLIYFSLLLPYINSATAGWLGAKTAHFVIMACSSLILTAGALCIGLSTTAVTFIAGVVLFLFGEGLPSATQAYIVSLVEKSKVARVLAMLSMASIFGKLDASILFPKLLALGLDAHVDFLVGLPLFVSAGMFVISALCVAVVGLRVRMAHKADA